MLVLSRRPGTAILIGHDVTVRIETIAGDDVCLSVHGTGGVKVERLDQRDVAAYLAERGRAWDPEHMHVLSRRQRPALLINGVVTVAVQSVSNESVRVGIEAPSDILIYREEVYEQMREANRAALADSAGDLGALAGLAGLVKPADD